MTKTVNFNLNKPEVTDPIRREDFNENAEIIDAALNTLNTAVAACGNCSVVTGSYTGTGEAGCTLELGFTPKVIILISQIDGNSNAALAVASDSFGAYWNPNGVGISSVRCVEDGAYLGGANNNQKKYSNYYIAFC